MPNSADFVNHCLELLEPLGRPRARRMFGGHGVYVDELFLALIADERLYLKVDTESRPAFEAAGCGPFVYGGKNGETGVLGYFSAPDEAIESPTAMQPWARLALAAALRARAAQASRPAARPRKAAAARR
jgi:DNA transformation protein